MPVASKPNGVCLPWLRSAPGCTCQTASGSKMQMSATPPTTRRPALAPSEPSASPNTWTGAQVTLANAAGRLKPISAPHFSARLSSSSSPVAPGSASPNGRVLASVSTGVWSDTSASSVPSAKAARKAARSAPWRNGGVKRIAGLK